MRAVCTRAPPTSARSGRPPRPAPHYRDAPNAVRAIRVMGAMRLVRRWLARGILAFVVGSLALVTLYHYVDPPLTPLMVIRSVQGLFAGDPVGIDRRRVPLRAVSPALLRSVIAAEDARFFEHWGVDMKEVERSREYNERQHGRRLRGASTISMQCARSVFLWPGRTYLRKAFEVYFTILIEQLWGKRRILEVYLNVAEWGPGIYGVEAAAQRYFGVSAAQLDGTRPALLAATLAAPHRFNPAAPSPSLQRRAATIAARAARTPLPKSP